MFVVVSLLMGLLAAGQAQTLSAVGPSAHDPHVRSLEKDADRLMAKGLAKSPTFRRLVLRLEQSDVIVYVRLAWDLPLHIGGRLHFLAVHGESRYLVVELQHAVEVAEAPDVTSPADLRVLYRRVGIQTGPDRYDSIAARRAGYDVLREEATRRRHSTR